MSIIDSSAIKDAATVIGLVISVIVVFLNRELEHRLTTLENNAFTKDEKKDFLDMCFKMRMLWDFYEKTLPILLKNPADLDVLLDKASADPSSLTCDERTQLLKYLTDKANSDDINRKYMALLYLKILRSKGVELK